MYFIIKHTRHFWFPEQYTEKKLKEKLLSSCSGTFNFSHLHIFTITQKNCNKWSNPFNFSSKLYVTMDILIIMASIFRLKTFGWSRQRVYTRMWRALNMISVLSSSRRDEILFASIFFYKDWLSILGKIQSPWKTWEWNVSFSITLYSMNMLQHVEQFHLGKINLHCSINDEKQKESISSSVAWTLPHRQSPPVHISFALIIQTRHYWQYLIINERTFQFRTTKGVSWMYTSAKISREWEINCVS